MSVDEMYSVITKAMQRIIASKKKNIFQFIYHVF